MSKLDHPALKGVIFVVDSSILNSNDSRVAQDTALYLHDVLLSLQRRTSGKIKAKISVLIAANKQDLFTALPAGAVRERLQTEIERVRVTKSKGLSQVGKDADVENEEEPLGGGGEEKFTFKLMAEEYEIDIDVVGGAVRGDEAGKGVRRWEEWIGSCL
jgi:signal recognition particle receptor subunit beta